MSEVHEKGQNTLPALQMHLADYSDRSGEMFLSLLDIFACVWSN